MFKDEFKTLRTLNRYTQEDLAKELDVSKSTISMYESGDRMPGLEMLEAIADFFNVDMNRLTSSTTEPESEDIIILNRAAKKMTPENRAKLLEMAKLMFKEDFE